MTSNIHDEILKQINGGVEDINAHNFNPVAFLEKARGSLRNACQEEISRNAFAIPSGDLNGAYSLSAQFLTKTNFAWAAEQLLVDWWELTSQAQLAADAHIYRASTSDMLRTLFSEIGDQGSALRWVLLCQADDLLHKHDDEGGNGRQLLLTRFGMKMSEHQLYKRIADDNLAEWERLERKWE